jgi:nitrogen regulatory protein PII-like uncharacterized protein
MKIKATIDRFEADKAVLIVGENEEEYIVPRSSLPRGVVQGLWLLVEVENNHVINAIVDEDETVKVKKRIVEKIARHKREGRRR